MQTRKFFIKMLVRSASVLNVRTSDFEDMGYNLKRDGWFNSFTNVKNQSMREYGVPWRGAQKKRLEILSIIFSAFTDNDDIFMDWQCSLGLFFISLFFDVLLSFLLAPFPIHFLTFSHFVV